jgi:acetaldehyde dehydrogenase (acetylating)
MTGISLADRDLTSIQQARGLAARASAAARELAGFTQERIDAVLEAMHHAALPLAQEWARLAVEETGFGNVPHKTLKNLFSTVDLYHHIREMKTVGVLGSDPHASVVEIASPVGVVAAIIPSTNPTSTAIYKIFISVKAGNAVVLSPHPYAQACIARVAATLAQAAESAGAPPDTITCMTEPALEGTNELMRHKAVGVILATGGTGLVRAAYSSGKPAFGVGPGNVPAFVDRTAGVAKAARDILSGKCFDNGVLCSSENAVVADAPIAQTLASEMAAGGAFFLDDEAAARLARFAVRDDGSLNTAIVGKSAGTIAELSGLKVPPGTRCLVVRLAGVGREHPLSREKLSPILAFYVEDGWEACCVRVLQILQYGGMGHTMAIHSQDRDLIMKFALAKPVFRICVNTPASVGAVGLTTALEPSMTLGCGALGGNITSDNIMPRHLLNLKRVAFETRPYEEAAPETGHAAAAAPPTSAPTPISLRRPTPMPEMQELRSRVMSAVDRRIPRDTPPLEAPRPRPAERGRRQAPAPVPFVSEADVRQALVENRCITIDARTIITPSARDLGQEHRVFQHI